MDGKNFRRKFKKEDLFNAYNAATPGATWNGSFYRDVQTGVEKKNHVLVYQDTYMMGGPGYMGATGVQVPEKYFNIK